MNILVYSLNTGDILRHVTCPDDMVSVQYDSATEGCIEHDPVNTSTHAVIGGKVVAKEPQQVEKSYAHLRWESYPSIEDQLDILYHEGYDAWRAAITEVKQKYPKPIDATV